MRALGLPAEVYESDPTSYIAPMMALAERITGVQLGSDLLQRRLFASRALELVVDDEGGLMGTVATPPSHTLLLIESYDPPLWVAVASAAPASQQCAKNYVIAEVLQATGLTDEPAAVAAPHRLAAGTHQAERSQIRCHPNVIVIDTIEPRYLSDSGRQKTRPQKTCGGVQFNRACPWLPDAPGSPRPVQRLPR